MPRPDQQKSTEIITGTDRSSRSGGRTSAVTERRAAGAGGSAVTVTAPGGAGPESAPAPVAVAAAGIGSGARCRHRAGRRAAPRPGSAAASARRAAAGNGTGGARRRRPGGRGGGGRGRGGGGRGGVSASGRRRSTLAFYSPRTSVMTSRINWINSGSWSHRIGSGRRRKRRGRVCDGNGCGAIGSRVMTRPSRPCRQPS
jgi:hypothetical protein